MFLILKRPEIGYDAIRNAVTEQRPLVTSAAVCRMDGQAIVYRLFDVGYAIDLSAAATRLAGPTARTPIVRREAQAIVIANPPLTAELGAVPLPAPDRPTGAERHLPREGVLSARLFDFGAVSIRCTIPFPPDMAWGDFVAAGRLIDDGIPFDALFNEVRDRLIAELGPALERPQVAPVSEDYIVFRLTGLRDGNGAPASPANLTDDALVPLLLNETRPLTEDARRDLLPFRASYTPDDLVVLSWDNALVLEPAATDADVETLLEFANSQILELRVYDALLDQELRRSYERMAQARRRGTLRLGRRFAPILADLQTLVTDTTEVTERVEHALRVTSDVALARVYSAALQLFRERPWRASIDRKLGILRDTYAMLNDEAGSRRMEVLEVTVVVLILMEIVIELLRLVH